MPNIRKKLLDRSALAKGEPDLTRYRAALNKGRDLLARAHDQGAAAQKIVSLHCWLVDQLVALAWEKLGTNEASLSHHSLVAVGGYGRKELHPHSDVDVMILIDDRYREPMEAFSERYLRFLWDLGLEIGHSVRDVGDCVEQAKADLTTATSLMETRLLAGNKKLLLEMQRRTAPPGVWPMEEYFPAKFKEQQQRHLRYHDTAYNLEPNIKEGPGGLRDIQVISWVAQRHFGTRKFKELIKRGFLSPEEHRALIRGRNFIWRLRNGLHYLAGRREDRLLFDHQRTLAKAFGYRDRHGYLAVEQMMQRYYRTAKELRLLNEILLQHFQEGILGQRNKIVSLNKRFQAVDGYLEAKSRTIFQQQPWTMLELILILMQHPKLHGIRASTIRLIRANLSQFTPAVRRLPRSRQLFIEIFRQPDGLTHALRNMNDYGILGAYLPVFERIVGQMQHDLFHVYTVDAHALMVVRNLRRLAIPKHNKEMPDASAVMHALERKDRLYIAGLFHDIAKGRGGDHSVLGEKEAMRFCRQHKFNEYDTHFVAWLVRHHLLMSLTAQRRDISDPEVIREFAEQVGDKEHLDNLYLLTIADIIATSPKVWNTWKARLLAETYALTNRALRIGVGQPIDREQRIESTKNAAWSFLAKSGLTKKSAEAIWSLLGNDYLLRHDPNTIVWHTREFADAGLACLPLVKSRYQAEIGGVQFLVIAPDSETLFANVAGGFERLNLSIADARIHILPSGLAILAFILLYSTKELPNTNELAHQAQQLRELMLQPENLKSIRQVSIPRQLKHFPIKTTIRFSLSPNGRTTVMELVAQDRPGLLSCVANALYQEKVRLTNAKIATFGERAEDVFFLTNRDGEPIEAREQLRAIEKAIRVNLDDTATNSDQAA